MVVMLKATKPTATEVMLKATKPTVADVKAKAINATASSKRSKCNSQQKHCNCKTTKRAKI